MRQAHRRTNGGVRRLWAGALALACAVVLTGSVEAADAEQCASTCRAAHNQCRIQSKGAPACDTQLAACIRNCGAAQKAAPPPKK